MRRYPRTWAFCHWRWPQRREGSSEGAGVCRWGACHINKHSDTEGWKGAGKRERGTGPGLVIMPFLGGGDVEPAERAVGISLNPGRRDIRERARLGARGVGDTSKIDSSGRELPSCFFKMRAPSPWSSLLVVRSFQPTPSAVSGLVWRPLLRVPLYVFGGGNS